MNKVATNKNGLLCGIQRKECTPKFAQQTAHFQPIQKLLSTKLLQEVYYIARERGLRKMRSPVATCVLHVGEDTSFDSRGEVIHLAVQDRWVLYSANISSQILHCLETRTYQKGVLGLGVHDKLGVPASKGVCDEVEERWMK
jgi:hypothetical protein